MVAFLGVLVFLGATAWTMTNADENISDVGVTVTSPNMDWSDVESKNVKLVGLDTGTTYFAKNADQRIAPASMTKIATAIVVLQQVPDLTAQVTLNPEIFPSLLEADAMMAGFSPGELVTVNDLLYALMLPSGAEAAVALAQYVAGDEDAFALLMNDYASTLELDNTHFTNASGLDDENHYSTASDIATLLQTALKNETFRKIASTPEHTTAPTNSHPEGLLLKSTVLAGANAPLLNGGTLDGGKTGFTADAGYCLASWAHLEGDGGYVLVTAGAQASDNDPAPHFADAITIYTAVSSTH